MKILDDILSTLDYNGAASDIRQGVCHTAVVARGCGLASTLSQDAFKQEGPHMREAGTLLSKPLRELAAMAQSEHIMEAAVGMATINSLTSFDVAACVAVNAADILAERGKGKKVVVIGHFPFVPQLKERVGQLWVIENNPRPGDLSAGEADVVLPQADVVGITGTSFTNHTIEHLLSLCRQDAFVLMLGDTTPMIPLLFDYGISALCGVTVIERETVLACVSQGANFRQIKGLKLLTMFKDKQ